MKTDFVTTVSKDVSDYARLGSQGGDAFIDNDELKTGVIFTSRPLVGLATTSSEKQILLALELFIFNNNPSSSILIDGNFNNVSEGSDFIFAINDETSKNTFILAIKDNGLDNILYWQEATLIGVLENANITTPVGITFA